MHTVTAEEMAEGIKTFLPADFRITDDMTAWEIASLEDLAFAIAKFEEVIAGTSNALEHSWAAYSEGEPTDHKFVAHLKAKRNRLKQRLNLLQRLQKHLIGSADVARQKAGGIKAMRKLANVIIGAMADSQFRRLAWDEMSHATCVALSEKAKASAEAKLAEMGLTPETAADLLEAYAAELRKPADLSEAA